jgi:glycerophosphoryl diester phosphodiesterase
MNDTLKLNGNKPNMIAHRGMSGIELENTCSAFVAAGNRSYFGIETDVHRTADGQFIIIHDDNTKRVAGDEMIVEKTCYETLRAIRLVDKDGAKGRKDLLMPSLREYIRICKKYEKIAVLELKNHFRPADIDSIIAIIREEEYLENTIFISFDLPNMICIRERLPEQKAQFLISEYTDWLLETLRKEKLDLDIKYVALTKERVDALHAAGIEVNCWTVDTLEDAQRMTEYGVDYITSNIVE